MTTHPFDDGPFPDPGPLPYSEATAVVGVEIDPQLLTRLEQVRACGCLEERTWSDGGGVPAVATANEFAFCPWCGKELYESRLVTIPAWDSTDSTRPLLAGLSVVVIGTPDSPGLELTDLGREAIKKGSRVFVGEIVVRTDAAAPARLAPVTPEMLSDACARVRARLDPLGLWDGKKFGVWAIHTTIK